MSEILTHVSDSSDIISSLVFYMEAYGSLAVFLAVLFFGETAVLVAIVLSEQDVLVLGDVLLFALLGTVVADVFWFTVGKSFPLRFIPKRVTRVMLDPIQEFFGHVTHNRTFLSIFLLKFFVGIRLAGILFFARTKISYVRFLLYDTLGSLLYIGVLTVIGVILGRVIQDVTSAHHIFASIVTGLLFIFILSYIARKFYHATLSKVNGVKNT